MKPAEYYKPYIIIKNPKVAAAMEQFENCKVWVSKLTPPNPRSVQSLKIAARLRGEKVTSHSIRVKHNIEKKNYK